MAETKPIRCFMDGIDWQHHIGTDRKGTPVFPSLTDTKREKKCLANGGGCGVVEIEIRFVRWVEEQDLDKEAFDNEVAGFPGATANG